VATDSRPIPVDEPTARAAADATATPGGWVGVLRQAVVSGAVDPSVLCSQDRDLVTDVPGLKLLDAGTSRSALAHTMESLRDGRDEIGRAALRILRSAAEGDFGPDQQAPYVGAAVLNPRAYREARRTGLSSKELARWAGLVPEPARARLIALSRPGESAA
jgi:hypothetical protein